MYNTSEEYLNAIKGDIRDFKLKGTMTTVSGDTIELDEDDIVMGSYKQNSSSQPGDLFQHGGVVAKDVSLQVLDRDYIIDNLTEDEWGRNLIIRSLEENGSIVSFNGLITSNSNYSVSDYIKVEPGSQLIFTKVNSEIAADSPGFFRWAWYSEDREYINRAGQVNTPNLFTWTVPNNSYFVRVSYPDDSLPKLEKGSTATPWTPAPEDLKWSYEKLDFSGGTISLQVGLKLEDESYHWIPMGKFIIDDFSQKEEVMTIRAIDEMIRLDEDYSKSKLTYPTTLKQIYLNICGDMDILPRTSSFLNDDIRVLERPEETTYREVLQSICELSGTFARMNRLGGLELVWFEDHSDYIITPDDRFSFNQDDFIANIPGIYYNIVTETETEDGEINNVEYSHLFGQMDGALDLSENLLLGSIEEKETVVGNVYDKISEISFKPYTASYLGDPSLDVGDIISQETLTGETFLTPITSSTFSFRGTQELSGVGEDYRVVKHQGTISSTIKKIVKEQKTTVNNVSDLEKAIETMSDLIVNTMGGHLTTTDSEIYIHDMPNLDDSTHVWKWGLGGFGYSETGVNGTYVSGIDANGTLVTRLISAGIVTADAVKTGILMTQDGKSYLDLDNGYFSLNDRIIFDENGFRLVMSSGETIEDEINNKATIEDINTIGDVLGQISGNLENTNDALGNLEETVVGNTTEISAQANQIAGKVSQTEYDENYNLISENFSEVEMEMDNIRAGVQIGGGNNLIKNSVGYGGWNVWNIIQDIKSETGSSNFILNGVSKNGFIFSELEMEQKIELEPNKPYTVSGKLLKATEAGTVDIGLYLQDELIEPIINIGVTETNNGSFSLEFNSGDNIELFLKIKGTGLSTVSPAELTDLFMVQGRNNEVWSQANGEVYTVNVKLDEEGIRVYDIDNKGYTVMSPKEFAGYYSNEKVFTVNKDITEVMGLLIKGEGLFMPPVKMVQNGNESLDIVWTGGI